MWVLLLKFLYS